MNKKYYRPEIEIIELDGRDIMDESQLFSLEEGLEIGGDVIQLGEGNVIQSIDYRSLTK